MAVESAGQVLIRSAWPFAELWTNLLAHLAQGVRLAEQRQQKDIGLFHEIS
jgi:hypothetical protein